MLPLKLKYLPDWKAMYEILNDAINASLDALDGFDYRTAMDLLVTAQEEAQRVYRK